MLIEAKNDGDVRTTYSLDTDFLYFQGDEYMGLHDSQNRSTVMNTSCFGMNFGMELTSRCSYDLCSAAIISRAATGRVGSRKFQLPLLVASCSVRGSPRPAVTLTLT